MLPCTPRLPFPEAPCPSHPAVSHNLPWGDPAPARTCSHCARRNRNVFWLFGLGAGGVARNRQPQQLPGSLHPQGIFVCANVCLSLGPRARPAPGERAKAGLCWNGSGWDGQGSCMCKEHQPLTLGHTWLGERAPSWELIC